MTGEVLQGIANIMHHLFVPVVQNGRLNEENESALVALGLDVLSFIASVLTFIASVLSFIASVHSMYNHLLLLST